MWNSYMFREDGSFDLTVSDMLLIPQYTLSGTMKGGEGLHASEFFYGVWSINQLQVTHLGRNTQYHQQCPKESAASLFQLFGEEVKQSSRFNKVRPPEYYTWLLFISWISDSHIFCSEPLTSFHIPPPSHPYQASPPGSCRHIWEPPSTAIDQWRANDAPVHVLRPSCRMVVHGHFMVKHEVKYMLPNDKTHVTVVH